MRDSTMGAANGRSVGPEKVGGKVAKKGRRIDATLCFIRRDGRLLLQLKAEDRFGAGRWNGPGGKVLPGETPENAAIREVQEETGLAIRAPSFHGTMRFVFGTEERLVLVAFIFCSSRFSGTPRGGGEGRLRWYAEDRLPYDRMWPDDRYWLPMVLAGGTVEGTCVFNERGDRILSCNVRLAWDAVAGRQSAAMSRARRNGRRPELA